MAILYSDLYGTPPNGDASTTPIYRGPHGPMAKGSVYVVRGVITIASSLGASDSAKLLKAMEAAKLLRMAIVPSADLNSGNDFTFNLGWTSAATAFASASTGLQAATAYTLAADALAAAVAAAKGGDDLVLTRVAGSLSAGSLTFIAEITH